MYYAYVWTNEAMSWGLVNEDALRRVLFISQRLARSNLSIKNELFAKTRLLAYL